MRIIIFKIQKSKVILIGEFLKSRFKISEKKKRNCSLDKNSQFLQATLYNKTGYQIYLKQMIAYTTGGNESRLDKNGRC